MALTYQGVAALLTSFLTGRGIGQTLLDDVNYDAVSAERFRLSNQTRDRLATQPSLGKPVEPMRKSA